MKTPPEIAHQVAGDWIMGKIDMGELERLIAAAVAADRVAVYTHAAQVAHEIESGLYTSQKTVAQALQQYAKKWSR